MKNCLKKISLIFMASIFSGAVFAQNKKYTETKAVILQNSCVLWEMNDDGVMVNTKKDLPVGTEITVLAAEDLSTQSISANWISNRTTQTGRFVKITYIDDEFYILDNRIAVGMVPGIITVASAVVYRTRNLADIKNVCLYSGRVVAVGKTYDIAGGVSLSEVAYFESDSSTVRRGYVRSDKISANRDDITAIEMINQANSLYDLSRRRQIISAVKDLNVSGNVLEMIGDAEMRVRRSSDLSLSGEVDVKTQAFYYDEPGSYVYIRDMPSTSGNVLGTLEYDEDFTVIRRTARSQYLYGISDFWYYGVSDDRIDGWIFGGFLTPRPSEEDEADLDFFSEESGSSDVTESDDEKGL